MGSVKCPDERRRSIGLKCHRYQRDSLRTGACHEARSRAAAIVHRRCNREQRRGGWRSDGALPSSLRRIYEDIRPQQRAVSHRHRHIWRPARRPSARDMSALYRIDCKRGINHGYAPEDPHWRIACRALPVHIRCMDQESERGGSRRVTSSSWGALENGVALCARWWRVRFAAG